MAGCQRQCVDVDLLCLQTIELVFPEKITLVVISESMPEDLADYFNAPGTSGFLRNTNEIFNQTERRFVTYTDYIHQGIYLTTSLKCRKQGYLVSAKTIENCSFLLEDEIFPFTNVRAFLLMGDFAIKSMNYLWKRRHGTKIIPSGATYKLRNAEYRHGEIRFFPSYTQTGESFGLEKSKVAMMKQDVANALAYVGS